MTTMIKLNAISARRLPNPEIDFIAPIHLSLLDDHRGLLEGFQIPLQSVADRLRA